MKYEPLNLGRWVLWSATALVFAVAPHVFTESFALTVVFIFVTFLFVFRNGAARLMAMIPSVFAILVIINFVVVTKGAGRVSEVSARFTLDALPGKQMAIDADLNAGLIGEDEARRIREEAERKAKEEAERKVREEAEARAKAEAEAKAQAEAAAKAQPKAEPAKA